MQWKVLCADFYGGVAKDEIKNLYRLDRIPIFNNSIIDVIAMWFVWLKVNPMP